MAVLMPMVDAMADEEISLEPRLRLCYLPPGVRGVAQSG